MPVAIAVSGSHGSGKSTLCYELAATLKKQNYSVGIVTESARHSHYLIAGDKSPEMHLEVFALHLVNEMRARRTNTVVICDRSIFDFVAYARIRFPEYHLDDGSVLAGIDSFLAVYKRFYGLILTTPGSFGNPDDDPVRRGEQVDSREFDTVLRSLLSGASIPFVELPATNRLEAAIKAVAPLLAARNAHGAGQDR